MNRLMIVVVIMSQLTIAVSDPSQVGEVRRRVQRIAEEAGFNETDCGRVGDCGDRIGHEPLPLRAGRRNIGSARSISAASRGVELLSIDRGPGLPDVSRSLTDGYSTGGTAGEGFGAVRRLSTEFDIFSGIPAALSSSRAYNLLLHRYASGQRFAWGAVNFRRRESKCRATAGELPGRRSVVDSDRRRARPRAAGGRSRGNRGGSI